MIGTHIRTATKYDIDAMLGLMRDQDNPHDAQLRRRQIIAHQEKDAIALIAFMNCDAIGYTLASRYEDTLRINDIFIRDIFRNKGVARRLLVEAQTLLPATTIEGYVKADNNTAQRFAKNQGFQVVSVGPLYHLQKRIYEHT